MLSASSVDYGVNTLKVAPAAIAAAYGDSPSSAASYVVHDVHTGMLETWDPGSGGWTESTKPPTSGSPASLLASLRSRVVDQSTAVRWTAPNADSAASIPLTVQSWNGSDAGSTHYLNVTAPGVYIHEIGAFNTFVPVPTGIPLFVGGGSSATPTPVTLMQASDLSAVAAGASADLSQAVDSFFANGGTQAMVLTVASTDAGSLVAALAGVSSGIAADLIVVPSMGAASGSDYLAIASAMVAAAATIEGTALLDPPTSLVQQAAADPTTHGPALAALADQIRGVVTSPGNAAVYSSPLVGPSPYGETPASVAVAAVIAQTDASFGTWAAPAGMRAVLPARPLLEPTIALAATLNAAGVNPLMEQGGTPVVWGGRTLDTEMPSRFLANARTLETIRRTIQQGLSSYVFQPNDSNTWSSVTTSVSSYLRDLWSAGGLLGDAASDAFRVQVGLGSSMTAEDVLNGVLRVNVSLAVGEPGVFVAESFEQLMAG